MMRLARLCLPALCALAILPAACGDDGERRDGGDGRTAEGEILPGSTSDAMIPLDQLRSQGQPLEPDARAESGDGAGDDDGPTEDDAAAPTEEAAGATVEEAAADEG